MGAGAWQVELNAPEGQSTAGGKHALQHLRLVPQRPGYSALVVGAVNGVLSTAELRTYDHVALQHEVRFKKPLEITPAEYEEFLKKADVVMNLACLKRTRVGAPAELLAEAKAAELAARREVGVKWAVVLGVAVLVSLLAYGLTR